VRLGNIAGLSLPNKKAPGITGSHTGMIANSSLMKTKPHLKNKRAKKKIPALFPGELRHTTLSSEEAEQQFNRNASLSKLTRPGGPRVTR
jgi:hypothetical protein